MALIKLLLLLTISICVSEVTTLNILGIFPYQGKSHFFVFEPYLRELAKRGHNVTIISHFPQKKPINNYKDISLAGTVKILEDVFPIEKSYATVFKIAMFLVNSGTDNCRKLLEHKEVQNLWESNSKYDIAVVEQFNSDCSLGLAYKLGVPVVGLTSHNLMTWHFDRLGVPSNPSFVPNMFFGGGTTPTFYERVERTFFNAFMNFLYGHFSQRIDQNTLAEYFDDVPPLAELATDIKFMLLYTNNFLFGSTLYPANVKEVQGYHVAATKQLPDKIQKFIDESEHGVIYISFGSMLKASATPRDKIDAITSALAELPQRVIWKWEEETLPGNPKNIYLSNWLPQNDILAHPKVLAFYSHCGLLGTTEAIHHGVPMLGMPIFGDQPSNAAAVEESGLGVQIQVSELTKDNLLKKFKTILDPEFRRKVKQLSKAWHDRPMSAMDSAIFWTEFAARNSNYTYRSPAVNVPLYQYWNLDIIAVFIVILSIIYFSIKLLFCKKSQPSNENRKKSKKA